MASSAASRLVVSSAASTTAATRDSLSGKTRKMVPSAMPAREVDRVALEVGIRDEVAERLEIPLVFTGHPGAMHADRGAAPVLHA